MLKWVDEAADFLTPMVLAVEYLIDPGAIFFGGRLADEILEAIMQGVRARIPEMRIDADGVSPEYRVGTAGVDAAALGVATLPIYEFFSPVRG